MTEALARDEEGRLADPESKTLEFKRDLSSPSKLLRTIAAFANSAGGRLVVGVDDDGTVIGVPDALEEEERLASLIADTIAPQLVPAIDLVTVDHHTILVVDVPLSTRRPHFMRELGPSEDVFVRLGSTTRQADSLLVAELERNARGVAFEDLPELRASLDDLDLDALATVRARPTNAEDLLALGLAVREGSRLVPTNAGILAAARAPSQFLPSAWVQCGRLRGPNGTEIFDQIEIHGPMPLAADRIMEFLLKHAFKSAEFGSVRRVDTYSIPVEAIREVVVSALVHANYAERSTPVRVAFFDDRIQVDSPGLLLPGMTIESMRHASRLRNPSLARIFREAGIMEQWGTGIQRVYEELAAVGLPEPEIEEVMDRVRFTVHITSHATLPDKVADLGRGAPQQGHQDETPRHQDEAPRRGAKDLGLPASAPIMMRRLLLGPASRAELLDELGISNQTRSFQRHIEPLLMAGVVERTEPDKPTSRHQRYRLTDFGRRIADKEAPSR